MNKDNHSFIWRSIVWSALTASVVACAGASSQTELSAAGQANAPTIDGALPTKASVAMLPDGTRGWSISCNVGRNFQACESRAQSLCPRGFHTLDMKQQVARNAPGMIMSSTGQEEGPGHVAFSQIDPDAVERTVLIKCVS